MTAHSYGCAVINRRQSKKPPSLRLRGLITAIKYTVTTAQMIKLKRVPALGTVCLKNTISPACSIHQRPRINIRASRDQFQRIQVIAEQKR